ncbi:MAG: sugar ABC transporter substrate-binding protein [Promethearchaeota archaeon]
MRKIKSIMLSIMIGINIIGILWMGSITLVKGQTSLTMWYMEDEFIDDTLLASLAQYESENDVVIDLLYVAPEDMRFEFKTAHVLGNAPDLIQGDAEWIPDLAHRNYILPIYGNMSDEYFPQALRAVTYFNVIDGNYNYNEFVRYGFPQSVDVMAFIYNIDEIRFASVPSTDEIWDVTEFQTEVTKMNDQSLPDDKQFGFSFLNFLDAEMALYYGAGGELFFNNSVDTYNNMVDSNESEDALTFIHEFVNYYELTPSYKTGYYVNVDNSLKNDLIFEDFAIHGNVSSSLLFAQNLKKLMSEGVFNNTANLGIGPVPVNDGAIEPMLNVKAMMVSTSTLHKKEAFNLAKYLSTPEFMLENALNENILPAIVSVYDHPYLSSNTIAQDFLPLLERATGKYLTRYWISVEEIFENQVTSLIRDSQNPSSCVTSLQIYLDSDIPHPHADHPGIDQDLTGYNILVDFSLPVIEISTSTINYTLEENDTTMSINIEWISTDDIGIDYFEILLNDTVIDTLNSSQTEYNFILGIGSYDIEIRVVDHVWNEASDTFSINVYEFVDAASTDDDGGLGISFASPIALIVASAIGLILIRSKISKRRI